MKLNVKGLVFVGFAAAILSANAMAAAGDEKIVTSKAFTEATYQAKLSGGTGYTGKVVTAGETDGSVTYTEIDTAVTDGSSNLVTSNAVFDAIDASQTATTYTSDGTTITKTGNQFSATTGSIAENGGNLVTSGTIHTALAGKQDNLGGTANQIPVTTANAGVVTYKNIATASSGIATGEATIPTSGAVADAISGAIGDQDFSSYEVKSNKVTSLSDASTDTQYPSAKLTYDQLALKQNASTAVKYDGTNAVGSATTPVYVDANGDVTASTYTIQTSVPANAVFTDTTYTADSTTITLSNGQFSATTGNVVSNNNGLVTGATVYNYLNGQAFPALPTGDNACSDSTPCALVMGTSGQPQWIRMAQ